MHDGTGWAKAGIDTLLSLDSVGIDVAARSIKLNNRQPQVPQRVLELEAKPCKNPDVVIQYVLPHHMDYNGKIAKNIGIYTTETTNFACSGWVRPLNTMDELWVLNAQMVEAARDSGVTVPIHVVNPSTDTSRFNRSYKPHDLGLQDQFVFYTIGEPIRRKNFITLLKAFHTEFRPEEPVELFLKTSQGAIDIAALCKDIKTNLRIYPDVEQYKNEIVSLDYWSDLDIMRLHATCDCFVSASHGESWCLGAFDAMGMGNPVICPNFGGFKEYVCDNVGWLVSGNLEPAFGEKSGLPNLFSSRENWFSVNQLDLQRCMREAYEDGIKRNQITGIKRAQEFSYENQGRIMKRLLEI